MINGFEEQTSPLTDYERDVLLPMIARGLSDKLGKSRAVTNKVICRAMSSTGYDVSEARVRKIINHIRTSGLVKGLIATSSGYYVATSLDELSDYVKSLEGRERAIRQVREAILSQMPGVI